MDHRAWAAKNLAARLLAKPWTAETIAAAIVSVLGAIHHRTRQALVVRLLALAKGGHPPTPHVLTEYLIESRFFRPTPDPRIAVALDAPCFAPAAPFADLPLPTLATVADLCLWLNETPERLDWFAGVQGGHGRAADPALQHYRYEFIRKRDGALRLIEAPKPRLKTIQRQILRDVLDPVPVHACAKGFVAGRWCLDGAQIHAGEAVVATFDLAQFFPSIARARVQGLFRSLGYPWEVSRRLAGLCATVTPAAVFRRGPGGERPGPGLAALCRSPHLPQGAPTSPALGNLLAWNLDRRLHGLARAAGANYSRYADDLAFSGDKTFAGRLDRFAATVTTIVSEEGFVLNAGKTRIMRRHQRQRVTGVVVNDHCNVGRAEYDALKAILHNCVRDGPAEQNRAGVADFRRHLDGRVGWVEQVNPQRGERLRALYERIDWRAQVPAAN